MRLNVDLPIGWELFVEQVEDFPLAIRERREELVELISWRLDDPRRVASLVQV